MRSIARSIFVPTVVLAAVAMVSLAYAAWTSAQQVSAVERDTQVVRAATALATALEDATEQEERATLAIPLAPAGPHERRLAEAADRVADLMQAIQRLALPPRAAETWRGFVEVRPRVVSLGSEVLAAARSGDAARLSIAVEKWRLSAARADALLQNFSAYYLRLLDRMVATLHERRVQALWTAVTAMAAGLLAAVALTAAIARAVVRPIVGIAGAAERIAETGRLAEVAGAERSDELGVLARAFNRMTERLLGANARLEEADRRKDRFLAMLSHELRNPLAPIRNAVALLARPDSDPAQARHATAVIERQVEHLARIVDDLLDVTRVARGKIELRRERLDASRLVARVCDDHRGFLAERGLSLAVRTGAGEAWVDADETRLAQVLGNLLHNAAKFTPRGGRVSVVTEVLPEHVELRVADDGVGMDAALLERIFDPFVQADDTLARTGGGLGLGLALVKSVVQLHGGSVRAISAGPGAGSELVVRLPRTAPPAPALPALASAPPPPAPAPPAPASALPAPASALPAPASAPPAPAPAPPARQFAADRSPRRVLVVDDNVDAAVTLAELVALSGHTTAVAHDGPSALTLARRDLPDVVLCDIGLPGMSGYEVARVLRAERGQGLLLVALSGYAQPEDVERAKHAGFDRHVAKPPHLPELQRLIVGGG